MFCCGFGLLSGNLLGNGCFASYNNILLVNILGHQTPSRRWARQSPDGVHHPQIVYILVKKYLRLGIRFARTRSFSGADIGSDHGIVMMTFLTLFKTSRENNNPTTDGRYIIFLSNFVDEDAELDFIVTEFNKVVSDTTTKFLGKQHQKKKNLVY